MTTTTRTTLKSIKDLQTAYDGSFYTILGAGGDPNEWVTGINGILAEEGIGTPVAWFKTTGCKVNAYLRKVKGEIRESDEFPDDLTILLFPLNGLDIGKLAIFKIRLGDRWFDDIIDNVRGK